MQTSGVGRRLSAEVAQAQGGGGNAQKRNAVGAVAQACTSGYAVHPNGAEGLLGQNSKQSRPDQIQGPTGAHKARVLDERSKQTAEPHGTKFRRVQLGGCRHLKDDDRTPSGLQNSSTAALCRFSGKGRCYPFQMRVKLYSTFDCQSGERRGLDTGYKGADCLLLFAICISQFARLSDRRLKGLPYRALHAHSERAGVRKHQEGRKLLVLMHESLLTSPVTK